MTPTLTPSEIEAVRAARQMHRVQYPGGSIAATDGRHALFASGGALSFEVLWAQAEKVRGEVKA